MKIREVGDVLRFCALGSGLMLAVAGCGTELAGNANRPVRVVTVNGYRQIAPEDLTLDGCSFATESVTGKLAIDPTLSPSVLQELAVVVRWDAPQTPLPSCPTGLGREDPCRLAAHEARQAEAFAAQRCAVAHAILLGAVYKESIGSSFWAHMKATTARAIAARMDVQWVGRTVGEAASGVPLPRSSQH